MKTMFMGFFILFIYSSLGASSELEMKKTLCPKVYPLKIIFGNYLQKDKAEAVLKKFQADEAYEKLGVVAKENDLIIGMRPLAGYTILVIEPIINNEIREKVMNVMNSKFEDVYSACAKLSKSTSQVAQKVQEVEVVQKIQTVKPVKVVEQVQKEVNATQSEVKQVEVQAVAKQVEIPTPKVEEKAKEINEYSSQKRYIWFFILAVLSALLLFYNIKYVKK